MKINMVGPELNKTWQKQTVTKLHLNSTLYTSRLFSRTLSLSITAQIEYWTIKTKGPSQMYFIRLRSCLQGLLVWAWKSFWNSECLFTLSRWHASMKILSLKCERTTTNKMLFSASVSLFVTLFYVIAGDHAQIWYRSFSPYWKLVVKSTFLQEFSLMIRHLCYWQFEVICVSVFSRVHSVPV